LGAEGGVVGEPVEDVVGQEGLQPDARGVDGGVDEGVNDLLGEVLLGLEVGISVERVAERTSSVHNFRWVCIRT